MESLRLLVKNQTLFLWPFTFQRWMDMKGLERLKKNDIMKNIPIIAITSFAMSDDRQKYLDAGFTDYI